MKFALTFKTLGLKLPALKSQRFGATKLQAPPSTRAQFLEPQGSGRLWDYQDHQDPGYISGAPSTRGQLESYNWLLVPRTLRPETRVYKFAIGHKLQYPAAAFAVLSPER